MDIGLKIDQQKSTPERIAEAIRGVILRGELAPGAALREADIAGEVGASRNTVREAMRLLAREGLVTHSAFKGVTVAELTEADVADIFRARLTLELAGVDAAVRATPEQVAVLEAAAAGFEDAVGRQDWQAAFEHDIELHAGIVQTIGSTRLDTTIVAILRELRLAYGMFRGLETEAQPIDREEHHEIVALIAAGERAAGRKLIKAHLERSEALLVDLMRASADQGDRADRGAAA
ncbi:MAG TPA: GntR family transcriptional regulator [Baekduia sp.]|uniref:GntR family transcriptional regulator n=1 Tax=Baekduia sp. TaxID=2600305 RepID=UPI002D77CAF1|nr:GntR family transcriptional regulator [Baekduia sp.]HET6505312.1 GntR family transcriptional regulator [Baekduia sp.]